MKTICGTLERLLHDLARMRSRGLLSEERFVEMLLMIEAEHVTPSGFTLTASNTVDDWTVFKLRQIGREEVCAALEFLPDTGEFRPPGSGPR